MKSAVTGDGGADKLQVQAMLVHAFKLTEIPRPDDAADALALALFGALSGMPYAKTVPGTTRSTVRATA